MGEMFKSKGEEKETKKEQELISDVDDMFAAFDSVCIKIDELTSSGYESFLPMRKDLFGEGQTPDDVGEVGNLRRILQRSRLRRMAMGQKTWYILEKIEELDGWADRYAEFLEQHIDALRLICRSSFKMIDEMTVNLDKLQQEEEEEKKLPVMRMSDSEWNTEFQKRIKRYQELLESGDKMAGLAKGRVRVIAYTEPQRRLIEREIARLEAAFDKDTKKIEPKNEEDSSNSPSETSDKSLSESPDGDNE